MAYVVLRNNGTNFLPQYKKHNCIFSQDNSRKLKSVCNIKIEERRLYKDFQ